MSRPSVREIVSVNAGEDDISQAPPPQGLGCILGLMGIQRRRLVARLDAAKSASACARIAHQHDSSGGCGFVASTPAIADVRTSCLFTYCVQVQTSEIILYSFEIVVGGDGCLEPFRQAGVCSLSPFWSDLDSLEFVAFVYGEEFFRWVLEKVGERGTSVQSV